MQEDAVHVRVSAMQEDARGETQRTVMETDGRHAVRRGKHYVRYADDSIVQGALVHTTLKLGQDEAWLFRRGAIEHEQRFIMGRETRGTYRTPYGEVALGVRTQALSVCEEAACTVFSLSYDLYAAGEWQSHHILRIEVTKRRTGENGENG